MTFEINTATNYIIGSDKLYDQLYAAEFLLKEARNMIAQQNIRIAAQDEALKQHSLASLKEKIRSCIAECNNEELLQDIIKQLTYVRKVDLNV